MRAPASSHDASGRDLAALVATEARLDRELADARADADADRDRARRDAQAALDTLDAALAIERAGAAAEVARAAAARRRAIEEDARAELAGWQAIEGARLDALARRLCARVASRAIAEEPP